MGTIRRRTRQELDITNSLMHAVRNYMADCNRRSISKTWHSAAGYVVAGLDETRCNRALAAYLGTYCDVIEIQIAFALAERLQTPIRIARHGIIDGQWRTLE